MLNQTPMFDLGPVHTGRGAPSNRHMQILEHMIINGSVHTGCKQHQRFAPRFACTSVCASCVNGALVNWLGFQTRVCTNDLQVPGLGIALSAALSGRIRPRYILSTQLTLTAQGYIRLDILHHDMTSYSARLIKIQYLIQYKGVCCSMSFNCFLSHNACEQSVLQIKV